MNWNTWLRQTHRWLSILFSVLVVVNILLNFVFVGQQQLTIAVGLFTLLPLVLLLITGLYLFMLPYAVRLRRVRRTAEASQPSTSV